MKIPPKTSRDITCGRVELSKALSLSGNGTQDADITLTAAGATTTATLTGGADYLVVGRPILQAHNPALAADQIVAEIDDAL